MKIDGAMTPVYVLIRPNRDITMNIGIPVTWIGTIMLAKNRKNNTFLNLNSNLAKINAAMLDAHNVKNVDVIVMNRLLKRDFPNESLVITFVYASNETFFGIHSTGMDIIAPLVLREVDIIHKNGIILIKQINDRTNHTPVASSFNFLFIIHPLFL